MNDDRRAMSVQNPMSINDLMSRQQPHPRMTSVPPNLPPSSNIRFSDGPAPRPRNVSAPRQTEDLTVGAEDEFGYELILNKNKMKKEEFNGGGAGGTGGGNAGGHDDELYNDVPLPADDYVDPRERAAFEHNGDAGPALPPFRPLSVGPGGANGNGRAPSIQRPRPVRTADTGSSFASNTWDSTPKMSYEELIERRKKVIEGLDKFRRRGLDVRAFPPDAPIEEMEAEYDRHKRAVDVEASIQFSRKMLMACVTGLEYLNHRYDPLGLQLEGWSESVIEDIHNYDDVFERLYDKYHTSTQMPPEFELLLMVAGSAFMFHLTNSMFKSAMPGMGNPDAMRTIRRGVMGAMSGAMSGAAGGGGISGMMNGMFGAATGQQNRGRPSGGSSQPPPRGNGPPPARTGRTPPRREMRGPSGNMDEMLNDLMDREPGEISNRLVEEIDDILNNPSDDDRDRPAPLIQSPPRGRAGPGGSISLPNPLNVDI